VAHGQRDFGAYAAKETIGSDADNAELAARLGSIVTFDRKGDVLLLDDFEDNINKWWISLNGVGAAIVLSNATARHGGSSCLLTTGNLIGDTEQISRYISYPVFSKLGMEIHFVSHPNLAFVAITLTIDDGVTTYWGGLRYRPPTNTLEYYANGGAWTPLLAGVPLYPQAQCFNALKMVIDLPNIVYSQAILGQYTIPMTQALETTATLITPNSLGIFIITEAGANANTNCYVDDMIITQNEP